MRGSSESKATDSYVEAKRFILDSIGQETDGMATAPQGAGPSTIVS